MVVADNSIEIPIHDPPTFINLLLIKQNNNKSVKTMRNGNLVVDGSNNIGVAHTKGPQETVVEPQWDMLLLKCGVRAIWKNFRTV